MNRPDITRPIITAFVAYMNTDPENVPTTTDAFIASIDDFHTVAIDDYAYRVTFTSDDCPVSIIAFYDANYVLTDARVSSDTDDYVTIMRDSVIVSIA